MCEEDSVTEFLYFRNLQDEEGNTICCAYKGVLIYITGAFCMALGVNLQKYSINCEQLAYPDEKDRRSLWHQPFWILGLITYGSSGALLSLALAFADQSQLAPLMSVVIVSNALLARFLLGEPVSKRDVGAICIIIVAVVLSTVFAPGSGDSGLKTTEGLIELYGEASFIVFVIILVLVLVSNYIGNRYVLAKLVEDPPRTSTYIFNAVNKLRRRATDIDLDKDKETDNSSTMKISKSEERFFAFSFGAQAGCWGGLCVTMMKSAITIIIDRFGDDGFVGVLVTPLIYALLAVLILCWVMQLYWISAGLERYPAVFVVSIEAVLNELVAVTGGILYFQEYKEFVPLTATLFTIGLLMGCFGILLFANRNNYDLEDDFFTCCPIKPVETEEDPRVHLQVVDQRTRRASYKSSKVDPITQLESVNIEVDEASSSSEEKTL